jgi:uncharacterized membrane protein
LEDKPKEDENIDISPVSPLPLENRASESTLLARASFHRSIYQGPLPPPEILKGYDLVNPGFAERVMAMAERQSQHRIELERTVVIGDHKKSWLGLGLGFVVAAGVFYGSYDLVKKGHDTAGTLLGGSTLVSLITVFVTGSNQRSKERTNQSRSLESLDESDD